MKMFLTLFALSFAFSTAAQAGKSEVIGRFGRTLKGPTKVTGRMETHSIYDNGILIRGKNKKITEKSLAKTIDNQTIISNFNTALLKSTRLASAQVTVVGAKSTRALGIQGNILRGYLPDGSLLYVNVVSEADSIAKSLKSRLSIITTSKNESVIRNLHEIFNSKKGVTFDSRGSYNVTGVPIDIANLNETNVLLLKLAARINDQTLGTSRIKASMMRKAIEGAK